MFKNKIKILIITTGFLLSGCNNAIIKSCQLGQLINCTKTLYRPDGTIAIKTDKICLYNQIYKNCDNSSKNITQKGNNQMLKFTRKEAVLLPIISLKKMKEGESRFFKSLDEMEIKPDVDPKTNKVKIDPESKEEMKIGQMKVVDLETGEEGIIILGFMVQKAFKERKTIKDLNFELKRGEKKGRTVMWTVYEISVKETSEKEKSEKEKSK